MRMPLPRFLIYRSLSSLSSPADALLAEKALTLLKRDPYLLTSVSSKITPELASYLLLQTQNDRTLILNFVNFAKPRQFFNPHCKCIALHILTKFKTYKTANRLAQDLAVNTVDEKGDYIFQCLKDTYFMCNSSSAVFDLVVQSYSELNFFEKAFRIVNLAKLNGFMPGILSYNAILDSIIRCRKPLRFAEEVYREMITSGVSLNVFSYNILIRGFCAAGNLEMGLSFFEKMERNGCLPNVVTYNTVIGAYCKLKRIDEAFKLIKLMGLKRLEPNLITYNMVINGFCREGRMEETTRFIAEMDRNGFAPNEVTYNTLLNGYCKVGNFHQALVLHAEMLRKGLSPDVFTYTSLINTMCKAGNLTRAMEFFDQMHVRGLHPNGITYTSLINGFSQKGLMHEAYCIRDEMIRSGFQPSIVTYNALLKGHCVSGRMEEAIELLRDMEGKGLSPNVVSYSTIITGLSRYQELDRAFQMKAEMVEKGVSPDAITFSVLIQGLCEQRRLNEACDLFQEMLNKSVPPDEFTYTSLINAYCKEGDLSKALNLHNEMIKKGFLPDTVTYNVLLNGLNKQARTIEAKRLLLKLFYDESIPNGITYDTLIESCSNIEFKSAAALIKGFCMKGLMKEADRVFESMSNRNQKPNEAVYNVIIHGHCRDGGNVQKAYKLYKEMDDFGFVPHTVTVIALVKALHHEGMDEQLNLVIGNILRSCKLSDAELSKVLVEINHKEGNIHAVFNLLTEMAKDGFLPSGATPANAGQ
ncbi:unnamed protein product [Dovyalis caffra]|uniref:Pentatricopeptide repeat-containing protein n=1 Tax=Dovyalis caffra TaxID=77055 RepID=A0AAV1RA47_9ROSI|nr:unnamed protein product [Dovyalis caffra]